jgi:hypothetical protein
MSERARSIPLNPLKATEKESASRGNFRWRTSSTGTEQIEHESGRIPPSLAYQHGGTAPRVEAAASRVTRFGFQRLAEDTELKMQSLLENRFDSSTSPTDLGEGTWNLTQLNKSREKPI